MSNNIGANDNINLPCANKNEVTGENVGDKRALHVKDIEALAALEEMVACIKELKDNKIIKIADETISALKIVAATSPTNIEKAEPTLPMTGATALGIAITTGAAAGAEVEIQTYGELNDSSFTFGVNEPLFLGTDGTITNVAPTTGVLTRIGTGMGPGRIFINIEEPIKLP